MRYESIISSNFPLDRGEIIESDADVADVVVTVRLTSGGGSALKSRSSEVVNDVAVSEDELLDLLDLLGFDEDDECFEDFVITTGCSSWTPEFRMKLDAASKLKLNNSTLKSE